MHAGCFFVCLHLSLVTCLSVGGAAALHQFIAVARSKPLILFFLPALVPKVLEPGRCGPSIHITDLLVLVCLLVPENQTATSLLPTAPPVFPLASFLYLGYHGKGGIRCRVRGDERRFGQVRSVRSSDFIGRWPAAGGCSQEAPRCPGDPADCVHWHGLGGNNFSPNPSLSNPFTTTKKMSHTKSE